MNSFVNYSESDQLTFDDILEQQSADSEVETLAKLAGEEK